MNKLYSMIGWKNRPSIDTQLDEKNLNKMDSFNDAIDNRVIEMDSTKADKTELTNLVKSWDMDENTGVITITKVSGEKILFDLNIEKIPLAFELSNDGILTMTTDDGTEFTADIGSMIPILTFENSDTIAVSVTGTGVNKTYSFSIKNSSVTEEKLQPNYLADIKVEVAKANASAKEASDSADDAAYDAKLAQSYAVGGSGIREGENEDSAKVYKEKSEQAAKEAEGYLADLQSVQVTGVKGNAEATYRKGNVNITKENIGLGNVNNTADSEKNVATANMINGIYTGNGGQQPPSYIPSGKVRFNMMNGFKNLLSPFGVGEFFDTILMDTYTGSDVAYVTAIALAKKGGIPRMAIAKGKKGDTSNWEQVTEVLTRALLNSTNTENVGIDSTDVNAIGYVINTMPIIGTYSDGALYRQVYNNSYAHEIYGDYRSGLIAVRGKTEEGWTTWKNIISNTFAELNSDVILNYKSNGHESHIEQYLEPFDEYGRSDTPVIIWPNKTKLDGYGEDDYDIIGDISKPAGIYFSNSLHSDSTAVSIIPYPVNEILEGYGLRIAADSLYFNGQNISSDYTKQIKYYKNSNTIKSDNVNLILNRTKNSVIIGGDSVSVSSTKYGMTLLGISAVVNNSYSTALGYGALALGANNTALGQSAHTTDSENNIIQLGFEVSALRCKVALSVTSDERDKTDFQPINKAIDFIKELEPVSFVSNQRINYAKEDLTEDEENNYKKYGYKTYNKEEHAKGTKRGARRRVGLKAQQVIEALEKVYGSADVANIVNDNFYDIEDKSTIPEGVENQYTITYESLIPYLISGMKELVQENKEIKEQVNYLLQKACGK